MSRRRWVECSKAGLPSAHTVRYSAVAHGRGLRRGGMSAWGGNGSDCGEGGWCTESQAIDGQKVDCPTAHDRQRVDPIFVLPPPPPPPPPPPTPTTPTTPAQHHACTTIRTTAMGGHRLCRARTPRHLHPRRPFLHRKLDISDTTRKTPAPPPQAPTKTGPRRVVLHHGLVRWLTPPPPLPPSCICACELLADPASCLFLLRARQGFVSTNHIVVGYPRRSTHARTLATMSAKSNLALSSFFALPRNSIACWVIVYSPYVSLVLSSSLISPCLPPYTQPLRSCPLSVKCTKTTSPSPQRASPSPLSSSGSPVMRSTPQAPGSRVCFGPW
ncbi:hypothetical protein L1887_57270 [Cichorium endivia]|nr:hypothetical protein L1887_57270 [Cichorium endivia]